jgi:hypothetical protein
MKDSTFKQLYAFVSLLSTMLWAVFCVWITFRAVITKETLNILGAAGADTLLGAMIVWHGNVNQFYFRKALTAALLSPKTTTTIVSEDSTTTPEVPKPK